MGKLQEITSAFDPAAAPYTLLTEHQLQSRQKPENATFIAESAPVIRLALAAGYEPVSFLMETKQASGQAADLVAQYTDTPVPLYTASPAVWREITGFTPSRGVLAVMKRKPLPDARTLCENASRVAVIENVTDATNVGAIIRSAAALGMDAVLVTPSCSDPLNRRSARVSMGTVFQIPWTYIGGRTDWQESGFALLRELGFATVSMALRADSLTPDAPELRDKPKLAIILGTEGTGLCARTIELSDYTVCIPMYHGVDSLNVAAAGAVAFYELRKR